LTPVDAKEKKDPIKKYLRLKDVDCQTVWYDKEAKVKYNILEYDPLIDHLGDNYKEFKTEIFYVSDLSPEGHQFVEGFSGIGGILRFKNENQQMISEESDYDVDDFI
jgi:peptide chain release factor subunit 1